MAEIGSLKAAKFHCGQNRRSFLRMNKCLWVLACLPILGLPGCGEPTPDQLIVGDWSCTVKTGEISGKSRVTYDSDGSSSGIYEVKLLLDDLDTMTVKLELSGSWDIEKDNLIEEFPDMRVFEAELNDESIDTDVVSELLGEFFQGATVVSNIIKLNDQHFVFQDEEEVTSCIKR